MISTGNSHLNCHKFSTSIFRATALAVALLIQIHILVCLFFEFINTETMLSKCVPYRNAAVNFFIR